MFMPFFFFSLYDEQPFIAVMLILDKVHVRVGPQDMSEGASEMRGFDRQLHEYFPVCTIVWSCGSKTRLV